MGREVAQLAGFIDQAGLFRTLGPVTNKLHFSALLVGFIFTCAADLNFLHRCRKSVQEVQTDKRH